MLVTMLVTMFVSMLVSMLVTILGIMLVTMSGFFQCEGSAPHRLKHPSPTSMKPVNLKINPSRPEF